MAICHGSNVYFYRPQTKFVILFTVGVPGPGGGLLPGGAWSGGVCSGGGSWLRPPWAATAAGGSHPTGMHSCYT